MKCTGAPFLQLTASRLVLGVNVFFVNELFSQVHTERYFSLFLRLKNNSHYRYQ